MRSAPHEVWLHYRASKYAICDVTYNSPDGNADAVRYLRADLTCEECKHHNSRECPHKESVPQGMGIWVYQWPSTRIGCFGFKPKEKAQ